MDLIPKLPIQFIVICIIGMRWGCRCCLYWCRYLGRGTWWNQQWWTDLRCWCTRRGWPRTRCMRRGWLRTRWLRGWILARYHSFVVLQQIRLLWNVCRASWTDASALYLSQDKTNMIIWRHIPCCWMHKKGWVAAAHTWLWNCQALHSAQKVGMVCGITVSSAVPIHHLYRTSCRYTSLSWGDHLAVEEVGMVSSFGLRRFHTRCVMCKMYCRMYKYKVHEKWETTESCGLAQAGMLFCTVFHRFVWATHGPFLTGDEPPSRLQLHHPPPPRETKHHCWPSITKKGPWKGGK